MKISLPGRFLEPDRDAKGPIGAGAERAEPSGFGSDREGFWGASRAGRLFGAGRSGRHNKGLRGSRGSSSEVSRDRHGQAFGQGRGSDGSQDPEQRNGSQDPARTGPETPFGGGPEQEDVRVGFGPMRRPRLSTWRLFLFQTYDSSQKTRPACHEQSSPVVSVYRVYAPVDNPLHRRFGEINKISLR